MTTPDQNFVLELQRLLNAYGAGLVEDGIWGPKTSAAYEAALSKPTAWKQSLYTKLSAKLDDDLKKALFS